MKKLDTASAMANAAVGHARQTTETTAHMTLIISGTLMSHRLAPGETEREQRCGDDCH